VAHLGAVLDRDRALVVRVGSREIDIYTQDPALASFHIDEVIAESTDCRGD
jgi:hypothetical protein